MRASKPNESAFLRLKILLVGMGAVVLAALPSAQQTPIFNAGTTVVPIDVRVVDGKGEPVTDLRQSDFSVSEDRVPQTITFFESHAFVGEPSQAAVPLRGLSLGMAALSTQVTNRRVFLITLGNGRLEFVSKGITAALSFVRERLLPQDQIAVMAWNRATAFTTDHESVASVLERFLKANERIERAIQDQFSGLRAQYGSPDYESSTQALIDAVFDGPDVVAVQRNALPDSNRRTKDTSDALRTQDLVAGSHNPSQLGALKGFDLANATMQSGGLSLDDFAAQVVRTQDDLSRLYAGIEYLRALSGEKHLVYVTQTGLALPSVEDEHDLAARASDARVVMDSIQTGGGPGPDFRGRLATGMSTDPVDPINPFDTVAGFSVVALETVAQMTGGVASFYSPASNGFKAIDRASSFQYLLAYSPTNTRTDGRLRRIAVKVNRRGLYLSFRRGYYATPRRPLTGREVLASTRILDTAYRFPTRHDFKLTATVADVTSPATAVDVTITVDASSLLVQQGDRHEAPLDVAILCTTGKRTQTNWHKLDVAVPDEKSKDAAKKISLTLRSTLPSRPTQVMVVAYNYVTDRAAATYARRERR